MYCILFAPIIKKAWRYWCSPVENIHPCMVSGYTWKPVTQSWYMCADNGGMLFLIVLKKPSSTAVILLTG